jgi:nucleotide-binding universal stress UspA family protein
MSAEPVSLRHATGRCSIIACVDDSADAPGVAAVAASLAGLLDLPLTLFHVIEPPGEAQHRPDPLDWSLRRQQARRHLARLRETLPAGEVEMEVTQGERVQTICERVAGTRSVVVIGASGNRDRLFFGDRTGQRVLEAGAGPVLLVPKGHAVSNRPFGRIMVPLDGSAFAESALVEAIRLAHKTGAELLLTHVVPNATLTAFGPPETADADLRLLLDRRNELAACAFLERTSRRITDQGLKVRSRCLKGDTRTTLQNAIAAEEPGLVILTSRGQGGRQCRDLSVGSTASYLLDHLARPMLLVPTGMSDIARPVGPASELRQPTSSYAA